MSVEYDAIVIGGGPGGSTASALLAEYGHRVLLLEREPFPRYHIGESLIPYTWFTLNRLGVVDWLRQSACPKKYSVQFVSITGKVSQPFYFFQTIKHECAQTWQVWRGEFDAMLLDNARSKGVEVQQLVTVRGEEMTFVSAYEFRKDRTALTPSAFRNVNGGAKKEPAEGLMISFENRSERGGWVLSVGTGANWRLLPNVTC